MAPTRSPALAGKGPATFAAAFVAVAVPLVVAVIALTGRRWYPVLDLAMTELRLRDVGTRHTPLIGLPGRIGTFPDQGSHPGPISFWLLAPGYRLFGSSAWAMEAATVMVHMAWISLAMWIGQRRLGLLGLVTVAAVVAVLIRGYGLTVLIQPWNPYLPLLAWLVVLLSAWSVLAGDDPMLIVLTVAATFVAQTHIPYLVLAGSIGVLATGVVVVRVIRRTDRRGPLTALGWSAGVFAVMWVGPLVDQWRRDPGNIRRLIDHFTTPSEDTLGLVGGVELLLRHLDVVHAYGGLLTGTASFMEASFDPAGPIWPGVAVLVAWLVAVVASIQLDRRRAQRDGEHEEGRAGVASARTALHVVVAVTLVLSTLSMMRIFGFVWFYLTLWAWVTTTLLLLATAWTAVAWARERNVLERIDRRAMIAVAGATAVLVTAFTSVAALDTDHPEERLGATLGMLVAPTAAALAEGVGAATGPDGRYVVRWQDVAHFGSQGYGLLSELERDGLDVGVYDTWRVPVTHHRVITVEEATAEVILVTGSFVEQLRGDARVVEVASIDPRTPAELAEYDRLRAELLAEIRAADLDDLVPLVDSNLFGLGVDLRLSQTGRELTDRMLHLGQETAVFIGAPGGPP
jgi:hypothetical protein